MIKITLGILLVCTVSVNAYDYTGSLKLGDGFRKQEGNVFLTLNVEGGGRNTRNRITIDSFEEEKDIHSHVLEAGTILDFSVVADEGPLENIKHVVLYWQTSNDSDGFIKIERLTLKNESGSRSFCNEVDSDFDEFLTESKNVNEDEVYSGNSVTLTICPS